MIAASKFKAWLEAFAGMGANPKTVAVQVLIPPTTGWVAIDADGQVHAYECQPVYDHKEGQWFPDALQPSYFSAFLCWSSPPSSPQDALSRIDQ